MGANVVLIRCLKECQKSKDVQARNKRLRPRGNFVNLLQVRLVIV